MILQRLKDQKAVTLPHWLVSNTVYLTQMGSVAYIEKIKEMVNVL